MKIHLLFPIVKYALFCLLLMGMIGCASVAPVVKRTANARSLDFNIWTKGLRSDEQSNRFRLALKTPDINLTGLFSFKKSGDEWRGALLNEMGVSAFNFIVTDEKCELLNVISMMDKWYIKKTVAADLYFLLNVDNPNASFRKKQERFEQNGTKVVNYRKKQLLVKSDGSILLINRRHNLQYELRKIIEIDRDKVIL